MSPELRAALEAYRNKFYTVEGGYTMGSLDAILQYAECNPTIPDRALCQCWGDVIHAAIPAALWEKVSTEG